VLGVGFYRQLSREEIAIAEAAARGVAFEPFRLTFAHVMSYPRNDGRNALVLIAEEKEQVNNLAGALAAAMVRRGFRPRGTLRGEAHLTLLYDRFVKPKAELDRAIGFDVTGLFLVRSHHGQSRHENQRFPFQS
jgi:2'-5' RNA ligase